jgi:hypothetical protein
MFADPLPGAQRRPEAFFTAFALLSHLPEPPRRVTEHLRVMPAGIPGSSCAHVVPPAPAYVLLMCVGGTAQGRVAALFPRQGFAVSWRPPPPAWIANSASLRGEGLVLSGP